MLRDKTIVLGVTGGVAAYKAAEIASQLTQAGAKVSVIMTEEALQFISAVTFRALTGRPVVTEMFDLASEFSIEHVSLAKAADVVVIAPATANIIARLAAGIADDMLCCTVLATKAPVLIAPAMETNMYTNPITQDNLSKLKARNFVIVGPATGWLASGRVGLGRLAHINDIIGSIRQVLGRGGDLAGSYIVVTAGGTQEPVDPVRYLGNRSSGKMGYAMAEAARERGAKVTLITAPTSLAEPVGVDIVKVGTAREMRQAVENVTLEADALVMAAAVADYRPTKAAKDKIKKGKAGLTLELECTPDILSSVKGNFIKVGFAAESGNLVENAREKLKQKKLDFIVANDITASDSGFGADTNRVTIIDRKGKIDSLPLLAKREVADRVLDKVVELLSSSRRGNSTDFAEVTVTLSIVRHNSNIPIYKKYWPMFPDSSREIELTTDGETIKRKFNHKYHEFALGEWVTKYGLKQGDAIRITPIVPKKRYHIQFAKKS
jgi:phosphopantothenoylcysteine decarboxylase/phosphopantothenate--cysteine ligase